MKKLALLLTTLMACTPALVQSESNSLHNPTDIIENAVLGVHANDTCGQYIGDTVCNLLLRDQNDNLWNLYDLEGHVIVLDFSAMWCAPCQNAAATVQQTQDDYESEGFDYVTVLIDNPVGDPVDLEDIQSWTDTFGITNASVLQGSRDLIDYSAVEGYPIVSWPTFVFIDRDLTIYTGMYGFNEEMIRQIIEEIL